jgi:soluble lytic murein transglycosylase-like protein
MVICLSTALSVTLGTLFFLIPKYFLFAQPETMTKEGSAISRGNGIVQMMDLEEINLNLWIENNLDDSIRFYTEHVTKDSQISRAIIENSIKNDLPINLAFSVAFKESKYKRDAYNDNGKSKDRGLFQLNDSYRQDWTIEDFYNIDKNSYEGTRYLSEMIHLNNENIEKALYCYNAGPTKVRRDGIIPAGTVKYAAEILEYEKNLNKKLQSWMQKS